MGRPKPLVELGGRPLISYAVAAVAEAGLEPVIIAKPTSRLPGLGCRVESDQASRDHPLAGIVAALELAGGPLVAVACDMPLVPAALIAHLASLEAPVAVPRLDGRLEPLLARYGPGALPALAQALEREEPLQETIASLDPELITDGELARFGDPKRILFNVNTPADLEEARRMLRPARPREAARR
jgi:molybdopterin-guanine dinucleotide biosynthesis protein A